MDKEQFLTHEDFKGQDVTKEEIEQMNGHPMGDGHKETKTIEFQINEDYDDEVIKVLADGTRVYRSDDQREMYRPKEAEESLLEKTPKTEWHYLKNKSLIEKPSKETKNYRRGFVNDDSAVVAKVYDEKTNRQVEWNHMVGYKALTDLNYFFIKQDGSKSNGKLNSGDVFYVPRDCEDKSKREDMLRQAGLSK